MCALRRLLRVGSQSVHDPRLAVIQIILRAQKPRAPIPTVPRAVGDNSTQTANIDSTTTSMSRTFDAMIEEGILQTVTFLATV